MSETRIAYVLYRIDLSSYFLRKVAQFRTNWNGDALEACESVFAQMNRGSGREHPFALNGNRSMSVGDVVVINNAAFEVESMGFHEVDMARVFAEMETVKFADWPETKAAL